MRVEITEEKLRDSDPEAGMHYSLGKGDIVTVSDACGKRWCGVREGACTECKTVITTGQNGH